MHAGIVGMGIMGRVLALALHNAGWRVTLFDQNTGELNCSFAAAGLLTPFSELDKADLLISHLGQESVRKYWPRIIRQLPGSIYFKQSGSLILTHPYDEAEWHYFSQRLQHQVKKSDLSFQELTNESLIQFEPELTKFAKAYFFPDEAHIDCQALMLAISVYLDAEGVKFLPNTPVLSLKPGRVVTESASFEFDMVFDCRGLNARSVFTDLRPLRGELIWLHAPDVNLERPVRLLHPRYSLYIVPRPDNIYLIGASEIEAEDYSSISVRTTLELLTAAYYVHAGFAEARIIKTVTHCRPTLSNHLPRIKFSDRLLAVNGLYRHGYLIAPAIAAEILRALKSPSLRCYPKIWET